MKTLKLLHTYTAPAESGGLISHCVQCPDCSRRTWVFDHAQEFECPHCAFFAYRSVYKSWAEICEKVEPYA